MRGVKFFVGLHQPSDAKHLDHVFISVNRLAERRRDRKTLKRRTKPLGVRSWIMDSGAFTELSTHGRYRNSVEDYAAEINRWADDPTLVAAVAQDYMCEPFIVAKTGLSVERHQELTIERYDALVPLTPVYVMPVLQGYAACDYVRHLEMYGDRLGSGAYVGVGSVCKRNTDVEQVETILSAIAQLRPDLRLHGFGLKATALASARVRELLTSADSMAWSFAARYEGRNRNSWREAKAFAASVMR